MINIPLCFIYIYSAIPQLRSLAMSMAMYTSLQTSQRTIMAMYTSLQTCFSFASQEHKTIRKHIRLLVKSDFTSNCTGFFGYEPYGSASLQTTPAYVHIPPNNPSVHPWLCTHPSKQPQRTSMAMYTCLQTTPAYIHGYVYVPPNVFHICFTPLLART